MSRSNLPALTGPQDLTEYNGGRNSLSRQELQEYYGGRNAPSRLDILEERLANQERTSQAWIDRAFRIKEDVVNSLNFSQGTWQEEKAARGLLQEHIRTITAVVNRLNNDIEVLDEQIRTRDNVSLGTNSAVKNLEAHHVTTLTDLRGRIVRCDTSIAKLSSDLRSCFDSVRSVSGQQHDQQSRLTDKIHNLESKVITLSNSIDKSSTEHTIKMQHIEGDSGQQLAMMDTRTRSLIEELKNLTHTNRMADETDRERLEMRLIGLMEKSAAIRDARLDKLERKVDDGFSNLDARLHKLEESFLTEQTRLNGIQANMETKLVSRIESNLRHQGEEISKLKRESREGFGTVHESITNMKTLTEGKQTLLVEQLRKEIGQVRKMVILV